MVVLEHHILSIKQKKGLRRSIDFKTLSGVTLNTQGREIVIHVGNEADIRFICSTQTRRKLLIEALKIGYLDNSKTNLPIYGVKSTFLQQYEKSSKDIKRGVKTKEPIEQYRLDEEDLMRMNLDDAICGLSEDDEGEEMEQHDQIHLNTEEAKRVEYIDLAEMGNQISEF